MTETRLRAPRALGQALRTSVVEADFSQNIWADEDMWPIGFERV